MGVYNCISASVRSCSSFEILLNATLLSLSLQHSSEQSVLFEFPTGRTSCQGSATQVDLNFNNFYLVLCRPKEGIPILINSILCKMTEKFYGIPLSKALDPDRPWLPKM